MKSPQIIIIVLVLILLFVFISHLVFIYRKPVVVTVIPNPKPVVVEKHVYGKNLSKYNFQGCKQTVYGCCPNGLTVKSDPSGSSC
jgi:hypothetical protein